MTAIKSYTDVKQSKNLLNLGLKPESADMCYIKHCTSDNPEWRFDDKSHPMVLGDTPLSKISVPTLPCWSIGALQNILPEIEGNYPVMTRYPVMLRGDNFKLSYYDTDGFCVKLETGSLLDVCYNMVIWLLENNYIK